MTKNTKQHVPIFLSSTKEDLIPYRKAAIDTLYKMKVAIKGMELFGARTEKPLEACLSEVSKSQYFVGVIGMRYGSIVKTTGKSIVQSEYEKAIEESLRILVYLINEKKASPYPPMFVDRDDNARKLGDFKEKLKNNHMVEFFESPKDLAAKVERDLLRAFSEKGIDIEKERLKPTTESEETMDLMRKFDLTPERFKGSEVELIIKFSGEPQSVNKELCQAIDLKFGHSLSRPIKVLHLQGSSDKFKFLQQLHAEYDGCDFLYDVPGDKEVKIIAKLAFGQERTIVFQPPPRPHPRSYLSQGVYEFYEPYRPVIKDIETDSPPFTDYLIRSPVKAIIFMREVGKSKMQARQKQKD